MFTLLSTSLAFSPAARSAMAGRGHAASAVSMASDFLIAPSILSADFARLGDEVTNVLASGADVVHFDVMDNHYVPNLTIGPMVCKALRKHGVTAPIDVHLMVSPVDRIIGDFAEAGASYITFHPEATGHIDRSLQLVKSLGCKSGLVFNPATPLDCLEYVMDKVCAARARARAVGTRSVGARTGDVRSRRPSVHAAAVIHAARSCARWRRGAAGSRACARRSTSSC